MNESHIQFTRSTVQNFPGLKPLLDEHIKDNFGELLPTLFFGDLTRYIMALLERAQWGELMPRRELKDLLQYLEDSYASGDKNVQDLVALGFLENLPNPGEDGASIRNMLGPKLQTALRDLYKVE